MFFFFASVQKDRICSTLVVSTIIKLILFSSSIRPNIARFAFTSFFSSPPRLTSPFEMLSILAATSTFEVAPGVTESTSYTLRT